MDSGCRVVATVHDSIVADVPIGELHQTASLMKEVMIAQVEEQLGWTDIPFEVDVSYGANWGTHEDYEFERVAA